MNFKLDSRFKRYIKSTVERFEFKVGVIEDNSRSGVKPKSAGTKTIAGGPARKIGGFAKYTNTDVSNFTRATLAKRGWVSNWLREPFLGRGPNKDIIKFSNNFLMLIFKPNSKDKKRVENLLQAIVRNPITRGDYGSNKQSTARKKGFNRLMIDSGQLFNSIKAKLYVKKPHPGPMK